MNAPTQPPKKPASHSIFDTDGDGDFDLADVGKIPLKSKKFIAYLIAEAGWKATLFYLIHQMGSKIDQYSSVVLITLIIVSGFIQVGYIIGQAALDRYAHIAESVARPTRRTPQKRTKKATEEVNDED